jgi:hypothetical protein
MGAAILDRAAVAALLGLEPDTISRYLHHSRAGGRYADHPFPAPDGHVGRGPWWSANRRGDLLAWNAERLGQGYRSDRSILARP